MNRAEAKAARIARRRPQAKRHGRPDFSGLPIRQRVLQSIVRTGGQAEPETIQAAITHTAHRRMFRGIYPSPTRRVLADIGAQRRKAGR